MGCRAVESLARPRAQLSSAALHGAKGLGGGRMEDEGWEVKDGGRSVDDGGWRVEDGR